ncbi:SDR family oxidoreductase [Rugosimonospora acidiphila]|uniref:SDR family oxidoreductase n=1 Tax=Rugosimonospora acidiphila TaxID=556531 RepID=A0ABP9RVU2_9ACTN
MHTRARSDRVAVVTGASHGIGYQIAHTLATSGNTVIVHARTRAEAHQAVAHLVNDGADALALQPVVADFGRFAEVRAMAQRIRATHRHVDLLVNNAATVGGTHRRLTDDGYELTFQVNYLAHYLLTRLLWPQLSQAPHGRVVNVSSALHRNGYLTWNDLDKTARYASVAAYAQSKLALTMLSRALASRDPHPAGAIDTVSVHPGVIATGTMRSIYGRYGAPVCDGADPVLYLCDAGNEVVNGAYYEGRMLATPAALVYDHACVDRLWRLSAQLTGLGGTAPSSYAHSIS